MSRKVYYRCCGYAYSLNRFLYRDLVHDAWVRHFTTTGEDLFNGSIYYALRAIRYAYQRIWGKDYYMVRGIRKQREFVDVDNLAHETNPERLLISKEFCGEFRRQIDNYVSPHGQRIELKTYVDLVEQGFKQKEISVIMGILPTTATYYKNKVKEIANTINNPITASKTKLHQKMTYHQFEKLKDKEKYKSTGEGNEYFDLMVDEESGKGILVRLKSE